MATLGIDFGSSFCTVSWNNPKSGKPEAVVFDGDAKVKLPSVMLATKDGFLLGYEAESYLKNLYNQPPSVRMEYMANFIPSLKRILDPTASEFFFDTEYSHLDLLKIFFKHLIGQALLHCGSNYIVDKIVFSHPVDFSQANIALMERAFRELGYSNIEKQYEPVSAVNGYGLDHEVKDSEGILVFDYGGGTIDVAFVKNMHGEFKVVTPHKGDSKCGGKDIDYLLYEHLRTTIQKEFKIDISENGMIDYTILNHCEELKKQFKGDLDAYQIPIGLVVNGHPKTYNFRLSREAFNNIIYQKVYDAVTVAKKVVQDATSKKYKIDKVLMIGGSSQLKLLQELLAEVVGNAVIETCGERDIVVALGNAIENGINKAVTIVNIEPSLSLTVDDTYTLTPDVTPPDAKTSFIWSSDNGNVVSVLESGVVIAKGVGSANITVKTDYGITANCKISVSAKERTSFVIYKHNDDGKMHFDW